MRINSSRQTFGMEAVSRSSSVFPNFIPENSSYIRHPNQLKPEGKGKQSDCVQKLAWKEIKIAICSPAFLCLNEW